jgi:hypothetical protein
MHLTHPVDPSRVKEDPLGGRRLTGIDMGHDADITEQVKGCDSGHRRWSSSLFSLFAFVSGSTNKKEHRNSLGRLCSPWSRL